MTHILKNQTIRGGIGLTLVAACATFGTGSALADPPTGELGFARADISISPRTSEAKEVAAGDLICGFRETGLSPYALVEYECKADAVAVVEGCIYKNKLISATEVTVAYDVTNVEGTHGGEIFIANNSGSINGEVVTSPEAHGGGGEELCPHLGELNGPEPAVEVLAARYCNASLTDLTNNIVGATAGEVFVELNAAAGAVPSCAEMLP